MSHSEFDLIRQYFAHGTDPRPDVALGVGDDCALLVPPVGQQLAVTTDTLVSGVHFFADVDPEALGHKSLAVSLSDLAAMGATPAWATLALTLPSELPQRQPRWLEAFSRGLGALARRHGVSLVGGDTTQGPLSITLQLMGFVPPEQVLRRDAARAGDLIFVSGSLGDAALALRQLQSDKAPAPALRQRLERPEPRVELGLGLRGLAQATIDVSDGLAADLGHILERSGLGARLRLADLPLSTELRAQAQGEEDAWGLALAGGDDYELCFCIPQDHLDAVRSLGESLSLPLTCIGSIETEPGLRCERPDGKLWTPPNTGYDHFASHE